MNYEFLTNTDATSVYSLVKYCIIVVGMWFIACSTSACGVKMGSTVIGSTGFLEQAYQGEVNLQKRRVQK